MEVDHLLFGSSLSPIKTFDVVVVKRVTEIRVLGALPDVVNMQPVTRRSSCARKVAAGSRCDDCFKRWTQTH